MHLWLDVARSLGLTLAEVVAILENAPHRYKVYSIPKRNGGRRFIAQPSRELKRIQHAIMNTALSQLPVHESATAYRKGRNIRDNAIRHAQNPLILKTDFQDFFNSIRAIDFRLYCQKHRIFVAPKELDLATKALFWFNPIKGMLCLSVGAPSSPLLSNLLMYDFDVFTSNLCRQMGVQYSRYADDITLSGENRHDLQAVQKNIEIWLDQQQHPRLKFKPDKTVFVSKRFRRSVTGLIITNDGKISIGRERKRVISAKIHKYKIGQIDEKSALELSGLLAYAKSVEPSFFMAMQRKYGADLIARISRTPVFPSKSDKQRKMVA